MNANTTITPPGVERFFVPPPPDFSWSWAVASALSLLVFLVASFFAIVTLNGSAWWITLPFWFTAFGSGIGFVYESWLLITKRPYQLFGSEIGRHIQTLRFGNLAPVFGSTYLLFAMLCFGQSNESLWLVAVVGVISGFMLALFFFQGPLPIAVFTLTAGLTFQLALLVPRSELGGGVLTQFYLGLAAVGLFTTTIIGSETPQRSTWFHLLATAVVGMLVLAVGREMSLRDLNATNGPGWPMVLAIVLGLWAGFRLVPSTWARFRSSITNAIWPLFYLVIAGGMRIPRPARLGELYRGREHDLKPLGILPYYVAHPRNLTHAVAVPCLDEALTLKVHQFGFITHLVKFVFAAASIVNRFFPFADIDVSIKNKPRMLPWSDGSHYWPRWLLRRIYIPTLGWFSIESGVCGPGFQATPKLAIDAYQQGQLLAFLAEYGIASSFLQSVQHHGQNMYLLDLEFLAHYETKPDYEPYGGKAYYLIDHETKHLKLVSVIPPQSDVELAADPSSASFRHAEDMILASIYFYVVSGKHLVEIHMGLNLVEVALFNSFDAKQQWFHPVRLALYPHLFAHELAEELTTQNLLEDKAVFPQIFATTNSALMRHLNDRFQEYELGHDEDFEGRLKTLLGEHSGSRLEDLLPHSSLIWEMKYAAIWQVYATKLVDAVYDDDHSVEHDECVQTLYSNLASIFKVNLPDRYDQLKTKAGLSRFISDTMHHLIIRHEVYGTTGVRLALDPRINKVQVPKDGGPPAIDEWRSLACVAMATSRVRYTLLMPDFAHVFEDLRDETVRTRFIAAHHEMQRELSELETQYKGDGVDNYETLRLLPSDLDIGAGY